MSVNVDQIIQQEALKSIPEKCTTLENQSLVVRQNLSQALRNHLSENSPGLQKSLDLLTENPHELQSFLKQLSAHELQNLHQAIEKNWPLNTNVPLEIDAQIQSVPKLKLQELDFGEELNQAFDLIDLEAKSADKSEPEPPSELDIKSLKAFFDLISAHYYVNHVTH